MNPYTITIRSLDDEVLAECQSDNESYAAVVQELFDEHAIQLDGGHVIVRRENVRHSYILQRDEAGTLRMRHVMRTHFDLLGALRDLGVEFSLDFDNGVESEVPDVIDGSTLRRLIAKHRAEIEEVFIRECGKKLELFHGGPLDGQSTSHHATARPRHDLIIHNVERAKWAVYLCLPGKRAFFKGYASSEINGIQMKLFEDATGKPIEHNKRTTP